MGGSRDDGRGYVPTPPGGRIEPAAIDRAVPETFRPRVYQPTTPRDIDLSGAVRAPNIGVPSISGSRSGPESGLASGRLARAGLDPARPTAAAPHPRSDDAGFRARYGSSAGGLDAAGRGSASDRSTTTHSGDGPFSGRARLAQSGPAVVPLDDDGSRGSVRLEPMRGDGALQRESGATTRDDAREDRERTRAPATDRAGRGDPAGRAGEARRRADALAKDDPATAERLGTAVRAGYAAGRVAGEVAGGVVVVTCGGDYGSGWTDGYWDPDAPCWGGTGWYWNSCWTGGWWWSWTWCWPYSGWWWGWNSCYRPWGYGWSTWSWCWSPWAYATVVYVDDDPDVVVIRESAPAVEVVPAAPAVGGAPAKPAPEIREALAASADEAIAAGDVAFREGRYSDAVRHYARAVEFAPERGALWLILSDALFATGDYHYAAYAFRKALDLDATLLEPLVDKHAWYGDPGEFDRHVAWAEAYLRDHVLDEDARLVLAANYLFARRYSSAVDALQSAFGAGLRDTRAGNLVLERAERALGVATPR